MAGIFQHLLEAISRILQATLQGTRTKVKLARDVAHFGTAPHELLLYDGTHPVGESILPVVLLQFRINLRGQHQQQVCIAGDEGDLSVRGAEDNRVARPTKDDRTTEMALQRFLVGS